MNSNKGGRPPSKDPRLARVVVKLTLTEAAELERLALLDGTSVQRVLRAPLAGVQRGEVGSGGIRRGA